LELLSLHEIAKLEAAHSSSVAGSFSVGRALGEAEGLML